MAGPLLSSFVAWVLQSAVGAGNDRLLFLARDGQILHRIAAKLSPSLGTTGLDGRYTYASRRALYLASIRAPEDPALDWLLSKIEGKTVAQVLERFDLTTAELAILLGQTAFRDSRIIETTLARELREMLRAEPVMSRVLANAAKRRALVREYMLGDVKGAKRVGIVDLGWKGRLQLCLERILVDDVSGIDGYYFALENVASFSCRGTRQTFSHYHHVSNPVLVETFALADHGTLLGFRRSSHSRSVEPVLDHLEEDSYSVREMQAAILDFLAFFLDAAEIGSLDLSRALVDLKQPAFRCFADLTCCPTLEEAESLGSFAHSDDQAHQNPLPIAGSIDISDIPRLIGLGPGTRVSYWPEASVRRLRARHRFVGSATRGLLTVSRSAGAVRYSLRRLKRRIFPTSVLLGP